MVELGTVLLGKYRIERVIGEGGMGVVARAHHLQLDQPVAIKFLLPEVLGDREVVQRFVREAQAAVKLRSEHVARVHDVGTLETGAPYMVMEYLEGTDLGGLLRQQGALAAGQAVDFMLQACEALAEAHALGIVHRDIKPANFFITRRAHGAPLLKVLDFGISKAPVSVDAGLTRTQAIMGTPAYMSPEQMRSSRRVDARADIWAVGVVLYELLTGRRPFVGETFSALCLTVAMDPLPPLDGALPAGLRQVVMRCLEKEPDARYQDMAALAAALAPHAQTPAQAASTMERTTGVLRLGSGATLSMEGTGEHGAGRPTTLGASAGQASQMDVVGARAARGPLGWLVAAAVVAAVAVAALVVVLAGDGAGAGAAPAGAAAMPAVAPAVDAGAAAALEANAPVRGPGDVAAASDGPARAADAADAADAAVQAAMSPDAGVAPAEERASPASKRRRRQRDRDRDRDARKGDDIDDILGTRQ